MATTADFRNGMCLVYNNDLYQIVEFQHSKSGRGAAFVRTKLKSITNGKTIENTFNSGEKVETARIEKRPHQFLYKDDMGYTFMDAGNFEQVILQPEMIENHDLMKEGQEVSVLFHAEKELALGVELPSFVELLITYSEPGVKGDTANSALKPATLETGAEIMVPLFVDQDEVIKVDTRDRSYSERVKK
jgi:elongation factor P